MPRPAPSVGAALAMLAAAALAIAGDALAQERPVVLRGATVLTATGVVLERGTVVFSGGRITAVGQNVATPAGALVVDLAGRFVMPGIIDPHSHIGAGSWPSAPANDDVTETTDPITPHVRVADAFNAGDPAIRRVVAGGVTTVQVFPGSGNVIGGEGVVVKLKPGRSFAEMRFPEAPRLMKMAVGENPKMLYGRQGRAPVTRMGIMALLRDAFTRAREYRDRWDAWQARPAAERGPAPARDARLEPLADVLRGAVRVHIHAYRRDELLALMKLADEFGFRIASFQHAMEAFKVVDELVRRGIGASVYPDAFGRKIEHWDQVPQNAAFLNASGALVSLHSDFPFFAQRLHVEAAKLLRYGGISEEDALKTITINAARIIGIDAHTGTLAVGKHADIAVFDRHPFDSFAKAERTYVDGELVFDRARDGAWLGTEP